MSQQCTLDKNFGSWGVDEIIIKCQDHQRPEENRKSGTNVPDVVGIIEIPQNTGSVALTGIGCTFIPGH
eukprot:m.176824 g.176824  ORF g.176824 m.176824 type:complete len:69 (+) comp14904_c0_seq2:15228-15434(+)